MRLSLEEIKAVYLPYTELAEANHNPHRCDPAPSYHGRAYRAYKRVGRHVKTCNLSPTFRYFWYIPTLPIRSVTSSVFRRKGMQVLNCLPNYLGPGTPLGEIHATASGPTQGLPRPRGGHGMQGIRPDRPASGIGTPSAAETTNN